MFYFKACPRCAGDMYLEMDSSRTYRKCLQCGRMYEIEARQSGIGKRNSDKLAA